MLRTMGTSPRCGGLRGSTGIPVRRPSIVVGRKSCSGWAVKVEARGDINVGVGGTSSSTVSLVASA